MQGERKTVPKKHRDRLDQIFQIRTIRRHYCKIIGVAGIMLYMELVFHKLIELIHIDVREELRREVADR